jgi:alginate O-acetyltransferase complex protein AlgI
MARGLGRMFGFEFPKNFDSPYQATSFQDFWRRWHITLSTWLRDNLYIPLGGSRHGTARTVLALAATMLLGGLWHGASWSFLVWGGLHGLYLGLERALRGRVPAPPVAVRRVIVLLGVLVAWVFFRIEDVGDALRWLSAMAGVVPAAPWSVPLHAAEWVFLGVAWAAALLLPNADAIDRRPTPRRIALTVATLVVSLVVGQGRGISPFLYFRF